MKDEIKEMNLSEMLFNRDERLLDYITNLQESEAYYYGQYKDYKSRNEKAIEYIKEHIKYECDDTICGMSFYSYHLYDFKKEDLLNILNGGDDNE